jgi:hypothetical protein
VEACLPELLGACRHQRLAGAAHEDRFKGLYLEYTLVRVLPEGQEFTSVCLEHKKDPKVIYNAIEVRNALRFVHLHYADSLHPHANV